MTAAAMEVHLVSARLPWLAKTGDAFPRNRDVIHGTCSAGWIALVSVGSAMETSMYGPDVGRHDLAT